MAGAEDGAWIRFRRPFFAGLTWHAASFGAGLIVVRCRASGILLAGAQAQSMRADRRDLLLLLSCNVRTGASTDGTLLCTPAGSSWRSSVGLRLRSHRCDVVIPMFIYLAEYRWLKLLFEVLGVGLLASG